MGPDPLYFVALLAFLAAAAIFALLRGGSAVGASDRFGEADRPVPDGLADLAARLRATLDQNAPMALAAWTAAFPEGSPPAAAGRVRLLSELLTFCQHAATRDDMIALADRGTTLSAEFDRWLGLDLARHLEAMASARGGPAGPLDPRLIAHARGHGWLAPCTLALARAGSPEPAVPPARAPAATIPAATTSTTTPTTTPAPAMAMTLALPTA